ncbi:P-loop containing nucleoside triphosphate hydrolase protein [Umbelopsis sp. PMI_123]|nr:P-loop containing nucleoside triphosphate hydrolase protein [Umbelopsis sp. PMI_123]
MTVALTMSPSEMVDFMHPVIMTFVYMGIGALVGAYVCQCIWVMTGESQTRRIRQRYVHSILRQDMGWFDMSEEGSLTTRLASDTNMIQDGISEKFGLFVQCLAQFITGFIIAFVKGWNLAVVILATLPLMGICGGLMGKYISKFSIMAQDAYADAGSVAEQAFAGIRTVFSFTLASRFAARYDIQLERAYQVGKRRGLVLGAGFGCFMFILFATYGLAFWYGAQLVIESKMTGPDVLVVFIAMIIGAMSLLQLPPNLSAISSARGAAYKIFQTIDRVPVIDPDYEGGVKPDKVVGNIEFKNVQFKYPTRPDVTILKNLSLAIKPGMTVAFVGPSGSGKSTSVQLLQRFYDPLSGSVTLDGHDLRELNLRWLRSNIGVVSQEPVLFNMTIKQNLLMGAPGEVTEEEVIEACKKANCYNFITQLPQGLDTLVGEHGGMLSGGQKQRIAIARALLKNPAILLLDEATSALDTQSERLVQKALDAAAKDRTTIVIAHRLSTIRNADLIVVMQQGDLIEQGTHDELLKLGGVYNELVRKQQINTEKSDLDDKSNEFDLNDQELEKALQEETVNVATAVTDQNEKIAETHIKIADGTENLDGYQMKLLKAKQEKKMRKKQNAPIMKVLRLMRPEWPLMAVGVCGAAVAGAVFPVYALVFSQVIMILTNNANDVANIAPGPAQGANLYALLFVVIGIAALFSFFLQVASFEVAGERFTKRFRGMLFRSLLKQEVGFYDEDEHSMGALTSRLAVDAANVNEMVTKVWGDVTQVIVTAITGLTIAFVYGWLLTFIILTMAPFILGAASYESRIHRGFESKTKKAYEQSGEVAGEAIKEIRTVAALNKQSHFEGKFDLATEHPHKLAVRKAYMASLGYAGQQSMMLFTNAVAFYAGIRLMSEGRISFSDMFTVMMAVMLTAQGMGRGSVFTSTFAKAKLSAISTFEIIDRVSKIDPDQEGFEIETSKVRGDVSFENVAFRYPARPDIPIFNGEFNLKGKRGQTIALVGPSGCGKSTTIGMLQRWYDAAEGNVKLDDHSVSSYSVSNLRAHQALVGQEPVLFDMSIGDNIRYGIQDNHTVTDEMVQEAAEGANIHKFITSLPDGYNTRVGDKGSQLSGGQKQRIAIARALIRKPKLLLLDEATSALDSESEKLVQEAIDKAIIEGGRTTITIAHRLSTIQNADLICVVSNGQVVEQGTHWELLDLNGVYKELVTQQSLQAH